MELLAKYTTWLDSDCYNYGPDYKLLWAFFYIHCGDISVNSYIQGEKGAEPVPYDRWDKTDPLFILYRLDKTWDLFEVVKTKAYYSEKLKRDI